MDVREEAMPVEVLGEADEVFITSSTKDVLAIHAVDGRAVEPGPVTARAAEVFAKLSADRVDP